jgi:hypothetical protein
VKKAGRPSKYTSEELIKLIDVYYVKILGKKISISDLEKEYNIPRHIWRDNKVTYTHIKELNELPILVENKSKEITLLPSISELVNSNYGSKSRLIAAFKHYDELLHDLLRKAILAEECQIENDKLKEEISVLKEELRECKERADELYERLKLASVSSNSLRLQHKLKVKTMVIENERIDERTVCSDFNILKEKFPELF